MSRVSIQMACGCTMLDMDPDARPQAMDVIADPSGNRAIWDNDQGFHPGRRYVYQCTTCNHVVCLNLNLLGDDE
jgi:hypothetical protein